MPVPAPLPSLWRTAFDKGGGIECDLHKPPPQRLQSQRALGHKQLVTCSTHNSPGIVSEICSENPLCVGSVIGQRKPSSNCSWRNGIAAGKWQAVSGPRFSFIEPRFFFLSPRPPFFFFFNNFGFLWSTPRIRWDGDESARLEKKKKKKIWNGRGWRASGTEAIFLCSFVVAGTTGASHAGTNKMEARATCERKAPPSTGLATWQKLD